MYGSWYAGSQASSWIFWWAFARLCRLTSTPHVGGGGLGRRRGRFGGGAVGPCGSAFSVPRKPGRARASWTPEVGGERGAVPPAPCSSWHGSQRLAGPRVVSI